MASSPPSSNHSLYSSSYFAFNSLCFPSYFFLVPSFKTPHLTPAALAISVTPASGVSFLINSLPSSPVSLPVSLGSESYSSLASLASSASGLKSSSSEDMELSDPSEDSASALTVSA